MPPSCAQTPHRPGGNPGANGWFLWSTPIQMLPRRGGVCGRLTSDLHSTRQEIVGIFHTPGEARQVAGELVHSLVQLDAQLGRTSGRDWIFQPRKTLANIRWEVLSQLSRPAAAPSFPRPCCPYGPWALRTPTFAADGHRAGFCKTFLLFAEIEPSRVQPPPPPPQAGWIADFIQEAGVAPPRASVRVRVQKVAQTR